MLNAVFKRNSLDVCCNGDFMSVHNLVFFFFFRRDRTQAGWGKIDALPKFALVSDTQQNKYTLISMTAYIKNKEPEKL